MAAKTKKPAYPSSRDAFGVTVLNSRHKDIRRIRRHHAPAIHGTKCWSCSYLLMDYFEEVGLPKKRSRVLEIGCGWGITGIYCAQHGAKVAGMDADDAVFPYLDAHAAINGVTMDRFKARFEQLTVTELSQYDLVVGGDICFWDKMVAPLWKLVERSMEAGVKQVILADLGRSPFEKLAKRAVAKYDAERIQRRIQEPVHVHGFLLKVDNPARRKKAS